MPKKVLVLSILTLLTSFGNLFALQEISGRMISLGIGFTGIIEDPFTDLQRNPAYMTTIEEGFVPLTIGPDYRYNYGFRSGIYSNPTPFLSRSKGGALVSFETGNYRLPTTITSLFPLENFASSDRSIKTTNPYPPTDLTLSGRSFIARISPSYAKSIRSSFSYSIPINNKLSIGANFLYGINGIGTQRNYFYEHVSYRDYSTYARFYSNENRYTSDNDERLKSLRIGINEKLSHRYDLDLEVTASRTRGKTSSIDSDLSERTDIYPDSTYFESDSRLQDTITDPADKEVIESNLFLHRKGDKGRTTLRLSFFSGDAGEENEVSTHYTENDSIYSQSRFEERTKAGWTGGLVGIGGSYELGRRPMTLYWGSFYGFVRGWQVEESLSEEGVVVQSSSTTRVENRWDNHLWQFNLATEYNINSSISARLGGVTTALLLKDRFKRESASDLGAGNTDSISNENYLEFVTDTGLTGGVSLRLSRWMNIDLYTPDLSSMNSWIFESFVRF